MTHDFKARVAKYKIGQVVRHRVFPFRGVVFDVDPIFDNTEEWYQSIPAEIRPDNSSTSPSGDSTLTPDTTLRGGMQTVNTEDRGLIVPVNMFYQCPPRRALVL